jgi:hypothetical protein
VELLAMGFAIAFVISVQERRDKRAMFAPAPCKYCAQWVRWKREGWVHADGRKYAEWPNLRYDIPGHPAPLHIAVPKAYWWPRGR